MKRKIIKNNNVLAISFLIVAFSIAYYFVIFLPKIEKDKLNQQTMENLIKENRIKQNKLNADTEIQEKSKLLDACLNTATGGYNVQWRKECERLDLLTKECKELVAMGLEGFFKKNNIDDMTKADSETFRFILIKYYDMIDECQCRLPKYNAETLNSYLKNNKDECFKKYPQN